MSEAPAIEARELTKSYGNFRALDHVSFSIPRGQILGYLGPNGAGKSTTINMLVGLLFPPRAASSFTARNSAVTTWSCAAASATSPKPAASTKLSLASNFCR